MQRIVPSLRSDEEVEAFLAQDLSDLDFSHFKHVSLKFTRTAPGVDADMPRPEPGRDPAKK